MIKVKSFFIGNSLRNLNHIIYCDKTGNALISDPYEISFFDKFIKEESLKPIGIINTHYHADHIRHNEHVARKYKIPILTNKSDQIIKISDYGHLRSIHTPGHVRGHYIFEINSQENVIGYITGDTVFNAGIGNCKNGGNVEDLYQTISSIVGGFSPNAFIYPSHDYFLNNLAFAKKVDPENLQIDEFIKLKKDSDSSNEILFTKISEELQFNPFLRLKELRKYDKTLSEKELFFKLRQERDTW